MTGKDKWMKLRRELMDSCGQCVGFRAKGLELPTVEEGHVCKPNDACPKHCPGFTMDFDEIAKEIAPIVKEEHINNVDKTNDIHLNNFAGEVHCSRCGSSEKDRYLLQVRHAGENSWVCTKCLPGLIHG